MTPTTTTPTTPESAVRAALLEFVEDVSVLDDEDLSEALDYFVAKGDEVGIEAVEEEREERETAALSPFSLVRGIL